MLMFSGIYYVQNYADYMLLFEGAQLTIWVSWDSKCLNSALWMGLYVEARLLLEFSDLVE